MKLPTTLSPDVIALNPDIVGDTNKSKSKSKYGNVAQEVDGERFDSKKESFRYLELKRLQEAGEIAELELQPEFVLMDGFVDNTGRRQRAIVYKADFAYIRVSDDKWVIEDVKSEATRKDKVFRLKWKMMLHRFREDERTELRLVD